MKNRTAVAIVQARMSSTRLPGKILADISGKPMLWHIAERLKHSKCVDKIVIATTVSANDDAVEHFCKEYGIDFYRGSEDDVLDRFYKAAREFGADIAVRITGDCPLIDPGIVDKVITGITGGGDDLDLSANVIRRTYPRGLDAEAISIAALEKVWKKANKDYEREHVTIHVYEHPEAFRTRSIENDEDLSYLRWTVDEEADLRFAREIYSRLYRKGDIFLMEAVLKLLRESPSIKEINNKVIQKAIHR